jgi:hypothetical protein
MMYAWLIGLYHSDTSDERRSITDMLQDSIGRFLYDLAALYTLMRVHCRRFMDLEKEESGGDGKIGSRQNCLGKLSTS